MRLFARRWVLSLAIASAAGCVSVSALRGRLDATRQLLDQAEHNGAMRCAPRELATGRAHVHFSEMELEDGDSNRAEQHYLQAEPNARAALALSPPERCLPHAAIGDRDHDGILDNVDQCPDVPETVNGFEDADGCPDNPDTDGDGVMDARDLCPLDPEDHDGYQDTDGCPEADNDADGLADGADHCANEPEDFDGFQDDDGCPDPDNDRDTVLDPEDRCPNESGAPADHGCPPVFQHLEVTQHGVRFHVEFDTNRASLRPSAAATLDEVVQFLGLPQNRELRYEVGGHTDSVGTDRHNDVLSESRAIAVRSYLTAHGAAATRLTAHGYGERQPIESNATAQGRQSNRRVELNEIDAGGTLVR